MSSEPTAVAAPKCEPLVEELPLRNSAWEVCQRLAGLPHVLFLDSASPLPELGRYSFVCADPFAWLTSRGRLPQWGAGTPLTERRDTDPFSVLADALARFRIDRVDGFPPFQGGAAGLFGYELCHHIERLPHARYDEFQAPELAIGFYDWVLTFDHQQKRSWLFSTGLPETTEVSRIRRAEARIHQVRTWLDRCSPPPRRNSESVTPKVAHALQGHPRVSSNFRKDEYLQAIERVIEYVHAGDCFQVNVAQRLLHPATLSPIELYGRLRERNPAPFAGYFDMGEFVLASASPERFLHVAERQIQTRPIKGTRPRGATPEEERRHAEALLASAKDRAENVMIVDLLRNDLGRVCEYGSIDVTALCRLETFRYVHHLVSEVRGRLRAEKSLVDLLRATFPGGSITGAPKVRAMEIIAELEPTVRGPYCGSLGYLGFDGSMDTNLLIRTCTWGKGWIQLPVGGGIVADSTPENEYAETLHKAEGLLRALG